MMQYNSLISLLKANTISYRIISVAPSKTLEQNAKQLSTQQAIVLRSVFLQSDKGSVLATLPHDELIDFKKVTSATGYKTNLIPQKSSVRIVPIPTNNTQKSFISKSIENYETVIFESGKSGELVQISSHQLRKLIPSHDYFSFTTKTTAIPLTTTDLKQQEAFTPDVEKRTKLERLYKLPAMPQMASELIRLKNSDGAHANDLARLIQGDPSLTAQIIRYAKSAFFNYQGDINSVSEAIARVIGFESVINIALGLSVGKRLKNPPDGPLGLNEFWKHAVYSATLAQALSKKIPKENRPKQDLAYLAGLLHNFGFLLLGHLFQPEFFLLNRLYAANLSRCITCIEKHALGMGAGQNAVNMGHAELGSWLLEKWHLPNEIVIVAREHHNRAYKGEHENYSTLIALVNNALGLHDLGDHREEHLSLALCAQLNLSSSVVHEELDKVLAQSDQIDLMIKQFAA
ncbi:MAG: hypothetical protein A6F70_06645 [Cycloclasticus sp. symbiont of Bathymodiolus heckerae]|nr:MAG: hypothetical protein A6F70_06645 [Cycloclasticus sp. symbiont of Bathymodiolus heckerae]